MARILVVGGNGFLGSHLVDHLSSAGHDIAVFDRFSGQSRFTSSVSAKYPGDFGDTDILSSAVQGSDAVFHFLSTTTPATADIDPGLDLSSNVAGTLSLLDLCVEHNVSKMVFASTGGAIYGDQQQASYKETHATMPTSPYGIGKFAIERYLEYYRRRYDLDYTVFRISNPYGPRQSPIKPQGLIPIAMRHILAKEPVTQIGDGSMVRDYAYVEDVARAVARAGLAPSKHRLYNVGSGTGYSVTEVFDRLRFITGQDFTVNVAPQPPSFVQEVVLDVSRFEAEFGTISTTSFDDGLRLTWKSLTATA